MINIMVLQFIIYIDELNTIRYDTIGEFNYKLLIIYQHGLSEKA